MISYSMSMRRKQLLFVCYCLLGLVLQDVAAARKQAFPTGKPCCPVCCSELPHSNSNSNNKATVKEASTEAVPSSSTTTTTAATVTVPFPQGIAGSKPPSCLNKCSSCTPCQLVKASQENSKVGSAPPSCKNKCNRCVPCQAVQAPLSSSQREENHFTVGFSNYMPETWKCKCGNQFFSP